MVKAIYAFSGDPITFGHIDIIRRAAKSFEELIVAIGINPDKNYTFSLEERKNMAEKVLSSIKNVRVVSFIGLLVDFAYENNINVIVKGVRNSSDFDYENILHLVGESQKLGIETFILFSKPELAHISSSIVKDIQKEHGLINDFVPLYVKQCLESKLSEQYIISITGEIGSGKSFVSDRFVKLGIENNISVHNIDLDKIGHQILNERSEPIYEKVRENIIRIFGNDIVDNEGLIDRKKLGEIVFNNKESLTVLNRIMYQPLIVRLKRELYGKKGLILINAALIAESNLSHISNNNSILIYSDKESQERRLIARKLSIDQIERRLSSQCDFLEKKKILDNSISENNQGKLWIIDNSDSASQFYEIDKIFSEIIRYFNI